MENRVSNNQLVELLDFLDANPALAKGVGVGSRLKENIDREWDNLAAALNAHGGGSSKSGKRWKRYWADLKHKVKTRASERRREARGTGSGSSTLGDLSEIDKKVLAIIGKAAVSGDIKRERESVPAFPTTTSNAKSSSDPATVPRVVEEELNDSFWQTDQEVLIPLLTSPSSRGNTSIVVTIEMPPSIPATITSNQQEQPPPPACDRESPVSCPRQIPKRPRCILRQASNVSSDWVIDLERRRVAAEEKQAEASLVIADALKHFVEVSRMHMEAMHKILDLLKSKNNNE